MLAQTKKKEVSKGGLNKEWFSGFEGGEMRTLPV